MKKWFKNLAYVWILVRNDKRSLALQFLPIVEKIFNFANKVNDKKQPMLTQIAVIDMTTKEKAFDMVTLWAGVGDANPIQRVGHLRAQNTTMKETLKRCITAAAIAKDETLILDINLILDTFE
jgi:hypothetical protein